jgi:[NiFe] hydrogenase assembly HybE family chaperone
MQTFAPISSNKLVERYRFIHENRMRGLPLINTALHVEAVGFCVFDEHEIGVLITPWFMNLVLLLGSDIGSRLKQGSKSTLRFPSGPVEFTTAQDEVLGPHLTAVLFSSVAEFSDQYTAKVVALEVMRELFRTVRNERAISRRSLFTNIGAS